ncbi:hypothetical protein GCM10022214_32120 [Actinomadura miaoliensis]|uniref:Uncharacterized protein n=1 Tax=Actinomadura miaoliensis TaxID=430685 RepID=A0ABP7VSY2_9ACTN
MLRSAYEAITNSRFGVLDVREGPHTHPLGWRRIADALTMVAVRVTSVSEDGLYLSGSRSLLGRKVYWHHAGVADNSLRLLPSRSPRLAPDRRNTASSGESRSGQGVSPSITATARA